MMVCLHLEGHSCVPFPLIQGKIASLDTQNTHETSLQRAVKPMSHNGEPDLRAQGLGHPILPKDNSSSEPTLSPQQALEQLRGGPAIPQISFQTLWPILIQSTEAALPPPKAAYLLTDPLSLIPSFPLTSHLSHSLPYRPLYATISLHQLQSIGLSAGCPNELQPHPSSPSAFD